MEFWIQTSFLFFILVYNESVFAIIVFGRTNTKASSKSIINDFLKFKIYSKYFLNDLFVFYVKRTFMKCL